jgi:excisionase family DNA binding protein
MQTETYNPFEAIYQRLAYLEAKLEDRNEPTPTTTTPEIMDMNALVNYLGNVSIGTVYQWMHRNIIPNYKVGRRAYFRRADIDAWLESKKRHTTAESVDRIRTKS